MKKSVKVLLSLLAAGASVSAVTLAVKKHSGRCGKPAYEGTPEDGFGEDEECFPDLEEEYEPDGTDEYGLADTDGDGNPAAQRHGTYLTADEADFLRYILEGIGNIVTLTGYRLDDIGRLARKRKITNAERIREIGKICAGWNDDRELLERCINDIGEVLGGSYPADFFEYMDRGQDGSNDMSES